MRSKFQYYNSLNLFIILLLLFTFTSLVLAQNDHKVYLPLIINYPGPQTTTSYYITGTSPDGFYNLGCSSGKKDFSGVIILSFGKPQYQNDSYGVVIFNQAGDFVSTSDIETLSKRFISGYFNCSPPAASITIAVGTSNCGDGGGGGGIIQQFNNCTPGGSNVNYDHGKAWAEMINRIDSWISAPPSYAGKVVVVGAIDIEPAWNYASDSRAWADGYDSSNNKPYYNFGSCDGCPSFLFPDSQPGSPGNIWSLEDIYYVSYGIPPAIPIPQIYTTNGSQADQWYIVKAYALSQNKPFRIKGVLTEYQACQTNGPCNGIDNTPEVGWILLYRALNDASFHADHNHGSYGSYNPGAVQSLDWLTDISW